MSNSSALTILGSIVISAAAGFTSGHFASAPAPQEPQGKTAREPSRVTLVRGLDVPVRSRDEADVTEDTRTVSFEAYYDWDFGNITLVSETGDLATIESPRSWEMRTASDSRGEMVALCFQPATGATYVLGQKQAWEPVADAGERTLGDYEVQISLTETGTLSAMRMDQMSGRTWMLAPGGWKPLPGNLPAAAAPAKGPDSGRK